MKQRALLFALCLGSWMVASAQVPSHPHYVTYTDGEDYDFSSAYRNWEPGKALYAVDDEEFFISRVKLKERFTNPNTQVDPTLSSERRMFWWVPIGEERWNAVPSYFFNSEVFNMWSYLDHWGNWTAPFLRAPGAYTDICHKNGVVTSVVAAVPFKVSINEYSDPHGKNMSALVDGGADKYLKFLRYYGVDGIGFNSEFFFSSTSLMDGLQNLSADAFLNKDKYGVPLTYAWYSVTNNQGGTGSNWDELDGQNRNWFHNTSKNAPVSNYFFLNYDWYSSELQTSEETAEGVKRSSYDVYAGMDMQGRDYAQWETLQKYPISIGIWGAHNMNMLFESRGENGSSGITPQETYLKRSEMFFTGGTQNPVNCPKISNNLYYSINNAGNFHGISSFITARSVLQTEDLAKEPFVTYFNLGNGTYFNVEGNTTFNKEWYNIGIQDYLPTWRWWWTSKFMGREDSDVPKEGMKAEFTWEDAWLGGSCMKIYGTTDTEYLQLFKTKYPVKAGDVLTIRYKVLSGDGNMAWACSAEGAESTEVNAVIKNGLGDVEKDEWIERKVTFGNKLGQYQLADKTIAMIGLKFTEAEDLKILVGEISLTRTEATTPKSPTIKKSQILTYNYKGADMKVIFSMGEPSVEKPYETIYNSDVDTWYFKIYTQQEGEEPVMCTATTSWAAYVVSAPFNIEGSSRMRIGVSAVSLDGKTESDIAWGDYDDVPAVSIVEGVVVNKAVIKSGETFRVSYVDPNHEPAVKWEIRNAKLGDSSEPLATAEGGTYIEASLEELGLYDLALTFNKEGNQVTENYRGLIQISSDEVGALPEIKEVKVNGGTDEVSVEGGEPVTYSYIGRDADGTVSRGLVLPDIPFGLKAQQLGFNDQTPFTIAYWFRPDGFVHSTEGTALLNIRDPQQGWDKNNWGYVWQDVTVYNEKKGYLENNIQTTVRGRTGETNCFDKNFIIEPGRWYHMCLVLGYEIGKGRTVELYMNGRSLGLNIISNLYEWRQSNYILFGGYAANRASFKGTIDEFQIYNKALTKEEALNTMNHQTIIPDGLIGYWDFETDPDKDNNMISTGTNKNLKASMWNVASGDGGEGVQEFTIVPATFDAGAPFIPGRFEVKTVPTWTFDKKAVTSNSESSATEGSVQVTYNEAGDYVGKLVLSNSWGSDSKEFPVVKVISTSDIDEMPGDETLVYPNPFENEVYLNFAESGSYTVKVYGLTGNLVSEQALSAVDGDVIRIAVNAVPGAYVVKVLNAEGKTVKAVKLIKK